MNRANQANNGVAAATKALTASLRGWFELTFQTMREKRAARYIAAGPVWTFPPNLWPGLTPRSPFSFYKLSAHGPLRRRSRAAPLCEAPDGLFTRGPKWVAGRHLYFFPMTLAELLGLERINP